METISASDFTTGIVNAYLSSASGSMMQIGNTSVPNVLPIVQEWSAPKFTVQEKKILTKNDIVKNY